MSEESEPPSPAGPRAVARLRQLGPQWQAAAENAFAGIPQSTGRYVAAGRWVSRWLERLRGLPPALPSALPSAQVGDQAQDDAAAAALLNAWDARDAGTPADAAALPLTPAERAALTACAFAIRYAEVAGWLDARERRRAMAAARAAGRRGWVVLDEAGEPAGDPFITYRRLEVDPETGIGVLVTTRPDDRFVAIIHEVQSVSVDVITGELNIDINGDICELSSREQREAIVDSLRVRQTNGDAPNRD